MVKKKSRVVLTVPDGAGGSMKLQDRRFEKGDWTIEFEILSEQEQADRWPRYLSAECNRRDWQISAIGQIERAENSGTIMITSHGQPQINIVWDRARDRANKVRASVPSTSKLSISEAKDFIARVNEACSSAFTEQIYVRGTLQYDSGLPWYGELWLDDRTRIGPPSLIGGTEINSPKNIHVDALLDCIGESDVPLAREQMLLKVSAFLSVVTKRAVRLPQQGMVWVWSADWKSSELRQLGYLEQQNPTKMPVRGTVKPVSLHAFGNPPQGIDGSSTELTVRSDVAELWGLYCSLDTQRANQFLQAAAKWQEAMIHWQDRPSLSFALMVVACEALKPADSDSQQNCYDVIEALLGRKVVDRLKQPPFDAQGVRSTHLHTGAFHGSELVVVDFFSSYRDPTFGSTRQYLAHITPDVFIEWLKRRGTFRLPTPKRRRMVRRLLKDNFIFASWVFFGLGIAIGWLPRLLMHG